MKGQIPITALCELDSIDAQWAMLSNRLINELRTFALIVLADGRKVKVELVLTKIIAPEQSHAKTNLRASSSFGNLASNGIARTSEFLNDYLSKHQWLMIGYIEGNEKKPIFLMHCSLLNLTIYTQKLKDEESHTFFPYASQN